MTAFLAAVTTVFTTVVGMVSTVGNTIIGEPILLTFTAIPLVGLGVGLFRRLLNIN